MRFSRSFLLVLAALAALFLTACGGTAGFPPIVTAIKPQSVMFGNTATIYIGGTDLRSNLTIDTGGGCLNPSFGSNSVTTVLVLHCIVDKTGTWPLTVSDVGGKVLYQSSITVPTPQVTLGTSSGNITLELNATAAPISVFNFLNYVANNYYESTLFHRVIPGFVIQGGGYTTGMVPKPGLSPAITLESINKLSNLRGTVAMARTSDPNSATSQFFINLVDNTFLDYQSPASPGYAVFGNVVQGLDVVDAIAAQATGTINGFSDVPLTDVTINWAIQIK